MTRKRVISSLVVVSAALFSAVGAWPERFLCLLPPRAIAAILLHSTPPGSTVGDVQRYIVLRHLRSETGRATPETIASRYPEPNVLFQYVRAELGHYRVLFRTDIVATFVFDARGLLHHVVVRKEVDAP